MWALKEISGVQFFHLESDPRFLIVFTGRTGGVSSGNFQSLNLGYGIGDENENVRENFSRLRRVFAIGQLVKLNQVHSNKVFYAQDTATFAGDGIFTDQPGLTLSVKVADCLPIYFYSLRSPVIGLCHAGWRGTGSHIGAAMAKSITARCDVKPADLNYAFGPCIGTCCYEVGTDVEQAFSRQFLIERQGKQYLDLKGANRHALQGLGLHETGSLDFCTRCHPELFYSARRQTPTGRNLAVIHIKTV